MEGARGGTRKSAWLTPAVEYLQQQRVRTMMMIKLAEATAGVDVYIVASNNTGGTAGRGGGGRRGAPPDPSDPAAAATPPAGRAAGGRGEAGGRGRGGDGAPPNPAQRHSTMANLSCYPAMNVPNGFSDSGQPTNVTFFARPFGEAPLIALAKAYQDAAGFHLEKPGRLDSSL
jgi:Asp-tRNA(Asn)/Glu-tRNA(Gln) amidotransferase A subunit family amidase